MRVYVTGGGIGFLGGHVARELREGGHEVSVEWADVRDAGALARAMAGCEAVLHVAALYSYSAPAADHEAVNVQGTHNVIAACRAAGVRRLVHTSTAGTCGPVAGRPADERDGPPAWELAVPYKWTKLAAERLVLAAAADGLDALCVNPTTPIGDGDLAPTPTGRMICGVATGRYRATLRGGGLNVVDVRDVARGHVLALERGVRGERYLLGGEDMTLKELFARVARAAGRPEPRLEVPWGVARGLAAVRLANRQEVALARLPMFFSSEKARRELGYEPGPLEPALERAVAEALQGRRQGGEPARSCGT